MTTLYLKYRPQSLDDLDITPVREELRKIVTSGRIHHAFLFAGPKGTGKTSAARILAKIVNCPAVAKAMAGKEKVENIPCNECESCRAITRGDNFDILELDAASNRGIDDIRSLREAIKLAPMNARKKVYIIDEVHMLTTEASNALLKTLEEPPPHALFILATTNPEKLLDTIKSRTTLIQFRRATIPEISDKLEKVAVGENVQYERKGLEKLAELGDGAFRDSVKLIEQVLMNGRDLTEKSIDEFLQSIGSQNTQKILDAIAKRDLQDALLKIEEAVNFGASSKFMVDSILKLLHSALLSKNGLPGNDIKTLSQGEIAHLSELINKNIYTFRDSPIPQLGLEIAILEFCGNLEKKVSVDDDGEVHEKSENVEKQVNKEVSNRKSESKNDRKQDDQVNSVNRINQSDQTAGVNQGEQVSQTSPVNHVINEEETKQGLEKNADEIQSEPVDTVTVVSIQDVASPVDDQTWEKILRSLKSKNATTEALMRAAKAISCDGKVFTIGVFYKFHKDRLEANPHRTIVEEASFEVLGSPIRLACVLTEPPIRERLNPDRDAFMTGNKSPSDIVLTEPKGPDVMSLAKDIFGV